MRSVAIGFVNNRQRLPEQQRTIIGGGVFSGAATACHSFDLEKGSLELEAADKPASGCINGAR